MSQPVKLSGTLVLDACLTGEVAGHLEALPFPHYQAADTPGLLVRIPEDDTRTVGRFVNRQFQSVKSAKR